MSLRLVSVVRARSRVLVRSTPTEASSIKRNKEELTEVGKQKHTPQPLLSAVLYQSYREKLGVT